MSYWLMKSEPSTFSVDDLAKSPGKRTHWDGVRNYQARNFMREQMRRGDLAFFYHSSCPEPGIYGIVQIVREAYPDPTQFDPRDAHYDAASSRDDPRWWMVDVKLERKVDPPILLAELRRHERGALEDLLLLKRGNRLSITPVSEDIGTSSSRSSSAAAEARERFSRRVRVVERACDHTSSTRCGHMHAQKAITRWKF